jgi:plasmid stabilization system protein ParE
MPLQLEIRDHARRDLVEIMRFMASRDGDPMAARQWAQRLLDRCENLTKAPGMGSPYLMRPGLRKLNEGPYKIFYQATDSRIVILRIWDGRREQNPRL